jgi:septum formation protein
VELLRLPIRVAPTDIDEESFLVAEAPVSAVSVALAKARAAQAAADEVVMAADTLVVSDGEILGKPVDAYAAKNMLRRLRSRAHDVLTGVVMRSAGLEWAAVVATRVSMRSYSEADIAAYVERGEPFDKAGGYAIQDAAFHPAEHVFGCYLNVVGLPLCAASAGLNALGIDAASAGVPPCGYCARGADLVRSGS